jgi:hypothetical protein
MCNNSFSGTLQVPPDFCLHLKRDSECAVDFAQCRRSNHEHGSFVTVLVAVLVVGLSVWMFWSPTRSRGGSMDSSSGGSGGADSTASGGLSASTGTGSASGSDTSDAGTFGPLPVAA